MYTLTPSDIDVLISGAANDMQDVFDLMRIVDRLETDLTDPLFTKAVARHVGRIMSGKDTQFRENYPELLGRMTIVPIDRITAELLVHKGLDPAAVCVVAAHTLSLTQIVDKLGEPGCVLHVFIDAQDTSSSSECLTSVVIGDGVIWNSRGTLATTLPETIGISAIGRPLRDVVSHPVLDLHDITITGLTDDMDGFVTDVSRPGELTIPEIMAMRPAAT